MVRSILGATLSVGVLAALAAGANEPMVFPSLGPTAYLVFGAPESPAAAPRSVILGHAVGLLSGQAALWACGLSGAPSSLVSGVDLARVAAAMLAIAATAAGTQALDARHPPAGATTLIVALGLLQGPRTLAVMFAAILLFTATSVLLARLLGLPLPLWSARLSEGRP